MNDKHVTSVSSQLLISIFTGIVVTVDCLWSTIGLNLLVGPWTTQMCTACKALPTNPPFGIIHLLVGLHHENTKCCERMNNRQIWGSWNKGYNVIGAEPHQDHSFPGVRWGGPFCDSWVHPTELVAIAVKVSFASYACHFAVHPTCRYLFVCSPLVTSIQSHCCHSLLFHDDDDQQSSEYYSHNGLLFIYEAIIHHLFIVSGHHKPQCFSTWWHPMTSFI